MFLIEVFGEYEEDPVITETFDGELEFVPEKTSSQISINAMNKNFGFQAMRFNGHLEKKTRHILIDLGSTYNFLDEQLAKKLGYKVEPIKGQAIAIAQGNVKYC